MSKHFKNYKTNYKCYYFSVTFKALYIWLQLILVFPSTMKTCGQICLVFYYLDDFVYALDFFKSREETLTLELYMSILISHTSQTSVIWSCKQTQPLQAWFLRGVLYITQGVHRRLKNNWLTLFMGKYQAKNQGWIKKETKSIT